VQVDHFRTVYELSAPAMAQLKSFSPAQLSYVVEAFGRCKVDDAQLFSAISQKVVAGRPAQAGGPRQAAQHSSGCTVQRSARCRHGCS
jgi:hypothetical protein